ncbi:hypothetical protein V1522DRAFT_412725 [Lipomyces starkeyi]
MNTAMTTMTTKAPALLPEPHHEMSVKQVTKPVIELPGLDDKIPSECASVDNKDGKVRLESFWIITIITGIPFISVSGTGILTTALPRISTDINLDRDLIFWPASVYALSAGCTLLALGSVADVIGSKKMWLIGSGLSCPLILF